MPAERARPGPARRWRGYRTRFGDRSTLPRDLRSGVVLGAVAVPDGLAAGLLAGVNPLHGVQAYMAGMLGGAVASGSVLMAVQATGAMAVTVSDVPQTQDPATSSAALVTLSLLTGLVMLALGLARLGSLVRFVPSAVMAGFVTAVAVNIALGQVAHVTGYESAQDQRLLAALDTVARPGAFNAPTVLTAALTAVLVLTLTRTRLGALGMLVALVLSSALAAQVPGLQVATIGDVASISAGSLVPAAPRLDLVLPLLVPALSLALVGLVQGAAVGASVPNPDGRYADPSSDFRGQGVANLFAALGQGIPVGGSMSGTSMA
ncbi:MAG: SulP family inorganic anion transporter, partial [Nocardioides sp.]|uniref:SulP family inorganic anion transporter n=1 Tax=Nocardioides sp. TaxID=35761 RepID=UPI003F065986